MTAPCQQTPCSSAPAGTAAITLSYYQLDPGQEHVAFLRRELELREGSTA